ncbi:MAG: 4Fe-4S binding protein [Candidatus Nezhaarchaeales archaeon]
MIVEIKINYDKCIGCRECVETCSYGVIKWLDDVPIVINPKSCALCLECEKKYPVNAIAHKEK